MSQAFSGDSGVAEAVKSSDLHPGTGAAFNADDFEPAVRINRFQGLSRPSLSYWSDAWMRLKKNRKATVSLAMVVFLALFTLVGPFLWRIDPSAQDMARISEGPTFAKTAVVIDEAASWTAPELSGIPAAPTASAENLLAPATLEADGVPSSQAVRLKWAPVTGASAYAVYRSETKPSGKVGTSELGVPIGEVDAGNKVGYEDTFNLERSEYFYSIVPKNGEEASKFTTLRVVLPSTIALSAAQALKSDIKVGETLHLSAHPFGTDYLGRDLLSRLMSGARVSLFIGFFAPLVMIFLGIVIGGAAGYTGGRTDNLLMAFADFVLALPFLLFMILFKIAFGVGAGESGIFPMLVAMVILSWPSSARLVRGQILQLRESEFVMASKLLGARPIYLLFRHLLPNTMGVILVSLTFAIPSAIFTEAFLSFIGMGVAPPTPSWGSMCNDGIQTFLTHPHEFLFPAIFISITVLSFNLLGDGLRDALDPRMRSTS